MDTRIATPEDYELGVIDEKLYLSYAPALTYDGFTGSRTFASKKGWTVTVAYVDGVLERVIHLEHGDSRHKVLISAEK